MKKIVINNTCDKLNEKFEISFTDKFDLEKLKNELPKLLPFFSTVELIGNPVNKDIPLKITMRDKSQEVVVYTLIKYSFDNSISEIHLIKKFGGYRYAVKDERELVTTLINIMKNNCI